jgi:hypothetical protein
MGFELENNKKEEPRMKDRSNRVRLRWSRRNINVERPRKENRETIGQFASLARDCRGIYEFGEGQTFSQFPGPIKREWFLVALSLEWKLGLPFYFSEIWLTANVCCSSRPFSYISSWNVTNTAVANECSTQFKTTKTWNYDALHR